VIEPPSIAIGGIGARAYNAQVRLMVDVDSNRVPAIGALLSLLGTRLHLPFQRFIVLAQRQLGALQRGHIAAQAGIAGDPAIGGALGHAVHLQEA